MAYPNQIYSAFAFLGFVLCAIPLPWHLESWNTGTCLYMIWTGLQCLNFFINSIIWNGNAVNWAPVWCDISTKFNIGTSVAIPAASLCINRRLYHIATVKSVTINKAEKRRVVYVDLAIGVGIPVLEMILHYIPQGHRFNVFEDIGCLPYIYNTWVGLVLVLVPPILIGLVSGVYAILSIIAFNRTRTQFNSFLSSHSNLTSSRYLRLMLMAGLDVLCTVPITSYILYLNTVVHPIYPWISWEDTHWRFSRVDNYPSVVWRADPTTEHALEFSRWLVIICAILFFSFFGFADEARKHYRSAVQSITKRVGISTGTLAGTSSSGFLSSDGGFKSKNNDSTGKIRSLPVFVHKEMVSRRDSLGSISKISSHLDDEKEDEKSASDLVPTLSYGAMTLSDVDGILSSTAPPSISLTHKNSQTHIEISSLRGEPVIPPPEQAHTADIV